MSILTSHTLGQFHAVQLGQVVDNVDSEGRGRIKVRLYANDLEIWASLIVPSAGQNYGVCCIPRIEEIVVVTFVTQDQALVLGSIWAGQNSVPEDADAHEDHYVVRTPAGTVMEFDDADGPKLEIRTPSGYSLTINDSNGGEIEIKRANQSIKMDSSEVKLSGSKIVLDATNIEMNAAQIKANAGISQFSGVIQSDTDISNAVVGTSYTPGAGNIW